MDGLTELLSRTIEQLLGRSSGPLHFRFVIQPVVATVIAVKAGLRDAREGRTPFLWTLATDASARKGLIRSGWKDIGRMFTLALLMDTAYQLFVLREFHPLQSLIVAIAVAVVPYTLVRGIVTRVARRTGDSRSNPSSRRAA
jgi:hypothetical protein